MNQSQDTGNWKYDFNTYDEYLEHLVGTPEQLDAEWREGIQKNLKSEEALS